MSGEHDFCFFWGGHGSRGWYDYPQPELRPLLALCTSGHEDTNWDNFSSYLAVVNEHMTRNCLREDSDLTIQYVLLGTELLITGICCVQIVLIVKLLTLKHLSREPESGAV